MYSFLVYVRNVICFSVEEKSKFECKLLKVCRSWFLLLRLYTCFKTLFFKKRDPGSLTNTSCCCLSTPQDLPQFLLCQVSHFIQYEARIAFQCVAHKFASVLLCDHYSLQCRRPYVNSTLFPHSLVTCKNTDYLPSSSALPF